jgi:hypothetical protein
VAVIAIMFVGSSCSSSASESPSLTAVTLDAAVVVEEGQHLLGGAPFTTNGGGTLSVTAPVAIQPSTVATGVVPDGRTWSATITFTNGAPGNTNGPFIPSKVVPIACAASTQCSRVIDGDRYQPPYGTVFAGGTQSWEIAFSCAALPGDRLTVELSHEAATSVYTFVGQIP